MVVLLAPHAEERIVERGATRDEVLETVEHGERFRAKHGRSGFRKVFSGAYVHRKQRRSTERLSKPMLLLAVTIGLSSP